jgi:NADH-quinone oxidoreductase subunit L
MPVTFITYAIGMLALAGFPILFSGFWSKDEILHAAHGWPVSHVPFYLGAFGALLTAFYMTRQVALVFFGNYRGNNHAHSASKSHGKKAESSHSASEPHESPLVMTAPLMILAAFAILLGFIGTPAWPWFQNFLSGGHEAAGFSKDVIYLMIVSSVIVFIGLGLGWWFYGRKPLLKADQPDVLQTIRPDVYRVLENKYWIDELYEKSVIAFNAWWAKVCNFLDVWIWSGLVHLVSYVIVGLAWVNRVFDEYVINLGFDESCRRVSKGGGLLSRLQDGKVQHYLRVIGVALVVLALWLIWGGRGS